MPAFPDSFADAVRFPRIPITPLCGSRDRVRWFPSMVRPAVRREGLAALESAMAPCLRSAGRPIDPRAMAGMTENYTEALPKTLRNWTAMLHSPRSAGYRAAESIGLVRFLRSASLRQFAERVSGWALQDDPGMQVIRYGPGDYVSPHNDHHPEEAHLRDGYVDLQITLTNEHVERQYLVYEADGYLHRSVNVGVASGVSVSLLPFWHQVTPLIPRRGREAGARRWLLLASFIRK